MDKAYGLLIDYEWCSGCHSCEVACKEEHNYPVGKWGIKLLEDGPWEYDEGIFNYNYLPYPTDLCDLCAERVSKGREPSCVHHCLANVMRFGTIEELAKQLAQKSKQVLFAPQYKPFEAKGVFTSKKTDKHVFGAVEVTENTHFTTSSQRADSRVDLGFEDKDIK